MSDQMSKLPENTDSLLSMSTQESFGTSLDLQTERGKRLYIQAMNGEPLRFSDLIGQTVPVTDALAHGIMIAKDEGGELTPAIRLVIFTADNRAIQCVSMVAFEALRRLQRVFGPLPWKGGIPLTLAQRSRGRNRMFTFDIPADGKGDDVESAPKPSRKPKE